MAKVKCRLICVSSDIKPFSSYVNSGLSWEETERCSFNKYLASTYEMLGTVIRVQR